MALPFVGARLPGLPSSRRTVPADIDSPRHVDQGLVQSIKEKRRSRSIDDRRFSLIDSTSP
jgi:hypothetical protein